MSSVKQERHGDCRGDKEGTLRGGQRQYADRSMRRVGYGFALLTLLLFACCDGAGSRESVFHRAANKNADWRRESEYGPYQKLSPQRKYTRGGGAAGAAGRRYTTAPPSPTTTTPEPVYPTPPKRVPMVFKDDIRFMEDSHAYGIAASSGGRWLIRHRPEPGKGSPWPMPQQFYSDKHIFYEVDPIEFRFVTLGVPCEVLSKAVLRTRRLMFGHLTEEPPSEEKRTFTTIKRVNITVVKTCGGKYPSLDMDESYDLKVKSTGAMIVANEAWGAIRGLETFSQIVYQETPGKFYVNKTFISDFPRFKHRGILLDTARHFLDKDVIISNLEAMAQNKMNVFHWHIVDDQSFPFQSLVYPELTEKGAFDPVHYIYTQEDIAEIIEEARIRGIRVIPEFDTPGHTISWGYALDNFLTHCFTGKMPEGTWGPMNPILKNTYRVLEKLFGEILSVFPDKYLHLGGDEVPFDCWDSNPRIQNFIKRNNLTDSKQLFALYERKLVSIIEELAKSREEGAGYIVWQEVVDNGVKVKSDTIVEVWMGGIDDIQKWTDAGLRTIFASCWYLDYISYGMDWDKYYTCEHMVQNLDDYQLQNESLLIGGEACLWTEYADNENIISRLWPRASATAERLWSSRKLKDPVVAAPRMEEHRCRMLQRGLTVGVAAGPGPCKYSERLPTKHRFAQLTEDDLTTGAYKRYSNYASVRTSSIEVHQYFLVPWIIILVICVFILLGNRLKQDRHSKIAAILLLPVSALPNRRKGIVTLFAVFAVVWCLWSAPIWLQTMSAKQKIAQTR